MDKSNTTNTVLLLSSVNRQNSKILEGTTNRKKEFEALRETMINNARDMGRDIIATAELYDTNILKGSQESRTERE